jgi:dTDP-4-amino-4,6-dideoxygalactose transaminase
MMALLGRRLAQAHRADTRPEVCERFLGALPPGVARVGNQVARHQYWLLPLRSADPLRAISILASAGFDATRGATSLRALEPTATPAARDLLAEVVYLPNPAHLPKRASKRLVRVISELHDAGLIA